jgi:hypothetical protein
MLNATATPPKPQFHYSKKKYLIFFHTKNMFNVPNQFIKLKKNSQQWKTKTYINPVLGFVLGRILAGG